MRVLLAIPEVARARAFQQELEANAGWDVHAVCDGAAALRALEAEPYPLAALHLCLPVLDGAAVLASLRERAPVCPPKTLLLCERELLGTTRPLADCVAPLSVRPGQLRRLMQILAQKKLPLLSQGTAERRRALIGRLLSDIGMPPGYKGRQYAEWLLFRLVVSPSPEDERLLDDYAACGAAFGAEPANVERCVRHAVERCFTQGDLRALERSFGSTVDAERGKLTNRAFLLGLAELLRSRLETERYSRTGSRSLNSRPMHHRPAAPTSV